MALPLAWVRVPKPLHLLVQVLQEPVQVLLLAWVLEVLKEAHLRIRVLVQMVRALVCRMQWVHLRLH